MYTGNMVGELTEIVERAEKWNDETPASGPEFAHEHTCSQCGSVCICDWADCDPNEPGTCQACGDWQDGRA